MKPNLILSVALLATSMSGFALSGEPQPCNSSSQSSSMHSKDQKQKNKKEKKNDKKQDQQAEPTGFSIYG